MFGSVGFISSCSFADLLRPCPTDQQEESRSRENPQKVHLSASLMAGSCYCARTHTHIEFITHVVVHTHSGSLCPDSCSPDNQPTNHRTSSSWPRPFNTTMSSSASATLLPWRSLLPSFITLCKGDCCLGNIKTEHQRTATVVAMMMMILLLRECRGLI